MFRVGGLLTSLLLLLGLIVICALMWALGVLVFRGRRCGARGFWRILIIIQILGCF